MGYLLRFRLFFAAGPSELCGTCCGLGCFLQQVPRLMGILYALLVQFYGWAVSSLQYLTSQSAARLVKMQEMAEFYVVNVPNMSDTIP